MSRRPERSAPPTEAEVRDEDWYGRTLSAETHTRVAFVDVDLTEVVDDSCVFDGCVFRGVRGTFTTIEEGYRLAVQEPVPGVAS